MLLQESSATRILHFELVLGLKKHNEALECLILVSYTMQK